jgi:hypothetical protein
MRAECSPDSRCHIPQHRFSAIIYINNINRTVFVMESQELKIYRTVPRKKEKRDRLARSFVCLSACMCLHVVGVYLHFKFRNSWQIFAEAGISVLRLQATSTPYFVIPCSRY